MAYYDSTLNVEQYIKMAEGYDGRMLVDVLKQHLSPGATVLELGMGAGQGFGAAGRVVHRHRVGQLGRFLSTATRQQHPNADVMQLDAVEMKTKRQFDAIYSNKVLYHLTQDRLRGSLRQQARVLKPRGLALHSFWYGDQSEAAHGLHFEYYTEESLADAIGEGFEWVESARYAEMEKDDSFYAVLRKGE